MKLSRLLAQVNDRIRLLQGPSAQCDPDISGLHYRAQEVQPGGMFVAIPGMRADGHDFVSRAVTRGAAAVVVERPMDAGVPAVTVADTRQALAALAAAFYGWPARRLILVGITGTNGKTTVSYLIESMLAAAGHRVGVTGTINTRYAGITRQSPVTTPESLDLQRILDDMARAGITHAVMEISSHALALQRTYQCWLDVGVFTNLTQDHLDYHGDMEAYAAAKRRMFTENLWASPKPGRHLAVINVDDPRGRTLAGERPAATLTVGDGSRCDVRATGVTLSRRGIAATLHLQGAAVTLESPLLGRHNLANLMCAAGVGLALGLSPPVIADGLSRLGAVPGRLEPVPDPAGRLLLVDYAHTPDALQHALAAVRHLTPGRLVCVFGCGGDRDRGKRPQMGAIAASLADLSIVTSDNPRTEDAARIIADIMDGIQPLGVARVDPDRLAGGFRAPAVAVVPDRAAAIAAAVAASRADDSVLVAGKGHETYQIVGARRRAFDDRQAVRKALAAPPAPSSPVVRAAAPGSSPWTLADLAAAAGGTLVCGAPGRASGAITIDSRTLVAGQTFVAIRGDTHDGHRFAEAALARGAAAVVVAADATAALPVARWRAEGRACIRVADTRRALGDIAAAHRRRCRTRVVAITGSCGKTATRVLTAQVIAGRYPVLATEGNLNNDIGLPLTLLRLTPAHRWAVVELGMNRFGEIARLAEICRPQVGVITNVAPVHLAGVGSLAGVARAKAELLAALGASDQAVLNADDPLVRRMAADTAARVTFFGRDAAARVRAAEVVQTTERVCFRLVTPVGSGPVTLASPARCMVSNALAAATVGLLLDVPLETVCAGLARYVPGDGRLKVIATARGVHVIDDTYNASPASVAAALETLVAVRGRGRTAVVLGDMLELGAAAEGLHRESGRHLAAAGVTALWCTGSFAETTAAGALAAARSPELVRTADKERIAGEVTRWLRPGDWLLIKGSRGMRMETVLAEVLEWAAAASASDGAAPPPPPLPPPPVKGHALR